jgi:DNA-binding CsgD family transcriptional regulator
LIAPFQHNYSSQRGVSKSSGAKLGGPKIESNLTRREHDILQLIAGGMSSKEIARHLGISIGGVNFHILNVMKKLGAATRAHAVARAILLGLLFLKSDAVNSPRRIVGVWSNGNRDIAGCD